MGGKYTGFISYTSNDLPVSESIKAAIIEMPDDGNGMNYTVKNRTATRHHQRTNNRYKKARKLIFCILAYIIKRALTKDEQEAISSLMLRRGYTRLETEIDLDSLKDCPVDLFYQCCPNLFNNDMPLYDQFVMNCDDTTIYKYRDCLSSIKDAVSKLSDKNEKNTYSSSLKTILSPYIILDSLYIVLTSPLLSPSIQTSQPTTSFFTPSFLFSDLFDGVAITVFAGVGISCTC